MKKKLFALLAISACFSLSLGLVGCDLTGNGGVGGNGGDLDGTGGSQEGDNNGTQSGTAGGGQGSNTSGKDDMQIGGEIGGGNFGDIGSGNLGGGETAPQKPGYEGVASQTVTQVEWKSAFDRGNYSNFTVEVDTLSAQSSMHTLIQMDNGSVAYTLTSGKYIQEIIALQNDLYATRYEDGKAVQQTLSTADVELNKGMLSFLGSNWNNFYFTCPNLSEEFENFFYDTQTGVYTSEKAFTATKVLFEDTVTFTEISLKIKDGKVAWIEYRLEKEGVAVVMTETFYAFGKTVIRAPEIFEQEKEEEQKPSADGTNPSPELGEGNEQGAQKPTDKVDPSDEEDEKEEHRPARPEITPNPEKDPDKKD